MPVITLNPAALDDGSVGFEGTVDGDGFIWHDADPGGATYAFLAGDVGANCDGGIMVADAGIAQGATINSAELEISGLSLATTGNCGVILGVDVDDQGVFDNAGDKPSTLLGTLTTANTQVTTSNYTSIDITSIIQELVDRGGWTASSNIALIWARSGNTNGVLKLLSGAVATDFDVVIDYTVAGGSTITRATNISSASTVSAAGTKTLFRVGSIVSVSTLTASAITGNTFGREVSISSASNCTVSSATINKTRAVSITSASTLTVSGALSQTLTASLFTNTTTFYSQAVITENYDIYHDIDFRTMSPSGANDTTELAPADGSGVTNIVLANNNDGDTATWEHITDPIQGNVIEFFAPGRSTGGNPTVPKAAFRDIVLVGSYASGFSAAGEGDIIDCSMLIRIEGSANGLLILDNEDESITYDGGTSAGFLGLRTRGSVANGYLEEDTSEIYSNAANLTSTTPLPLDQWFVLRKRVTLSADDTVGKIEFWIDGESVTMTNVVTAATDGHTRTLLEPTEFFNETGFTIDGGQVAAYDSLEYGATANSVEGSTDKTMQVAAVKAYGIFKAEEITRFASITSASTLTVARDIARVRAVDISSQSTLTVSATISKAAAASMVSASTVTVDTPTKTLTRVVDVISASTFTADYVGTKRRTTEINSVSVLSAVSTVTRLRSTLVAANSTVNAEATITHSRTASVEAVSTITVIPQISGVIVRAVSIEAESTVAATASKTIQRITAIAANSSFATSSQVSSIILRSLSVEAVSALSAISVITKVRVISISAQSTLAATNFNRDPRSENSGSKPNSVKQQPRNRNKVG